MQHYPFAVDQRFLPLLAPLLLPRPSAHGVRITDDGTLRASLGPLKLTTPMGNISGAHITRDYRWWTALGIRLSGADDGLTFGTNRDAGVCIHFATKVPTALRRRGHSALTVTVADLTGLTAALGGGDTPDPER